MKKILKVAVGILVILLFAGCPTPTDPTPNDPTPAASENPGFSTASSPGDSGILTLSESSETLKIIYANNQISITFPTGADDTGNATLSTRFFMGETEVTNAVMAAVLQWAYDSGRFSSIVGDHNGLDSTTVRHGGQPLLYLDDVDCMVDYDGSGNFTVESSYENNPVTNVTWYGSVIFCNWLTEMRDGNTDNLVYTGIDTDWIDDETIETVTNNGYRLPSSDEWEYTARYRGTDTINTVSGYTDPYFTKGNSASGATADYTNTAACQVVAVYMGSNPVPTDEAIVKSLGVESSNALGLYDMSGNVEEWGFSESGSSRVFFGSDWRVALSFWLRLGVVKSALPDSNDKVYGFRLCRTAD